MDFLNQLEVKITSKVIMDNVLYHSTDLWNAVEILKTRTFRLSAVAGSDVEMQITGRKKRLFYLSLARDKTNTFRVTSAFGIGVTFVLDKDWFTRKYSVVPVDYWQDWKSKVGTGRESVEFGVPRFGETEERLWYDKNTISIPTQVIKEIHFVFKTEDFDRKVGTFNARLADLISYSKRSSIPLYSYTNPKDYLLINKNKAIPTKSLISMIDLKKDQPYNYRFLSRDFLEPWKELFFKISKRDLSTRAREIAYRLAYNNWGIGDDIAGLQAELKNGMKTDNVFKFLLLWKKIKVNTTKEFIEYLRKKWKAIYERERDK